MASRSCVSGCGRFLASSDGHDSFPSCLGYQHAEAALVDESCSHCGNMTIAMLRSRYLLALPRSSSSASALHAMALLQVQAKALKQLLEGGAVQELRTATDLALRATKVTARALGQTMSTLVVQEHHLWLTLADMRESDKHRLLDSPISQAGLFGKAVEDIAHQFSATQKQMEAFRHILPRRSAAVSTPPPAAAPPSARRRGRPPAASTSAPARPQQKPSQRPQRGAGRRKVAQPASAPAKPVKRQGRQRPWDGRPGASGSCSSGDGDRTTPFPGGGPGGESFVSFCSVPQLAPGMPSPAPPAQPWSQVSIAPHTQATIRDALPFESGPCAPLRCPTAGTSVTPLDPLVRSLGAWLAGSWGPSDSATRFSSPGVLPSSGAFGSPQCWTRMPLSCVQKSRSYWRRTR